MDGDNLQKVADILEIRELKAAYCETCDAAVQQRDAKVLARLKDIATEDVKSDYGMGALDGREALIGFLTGVTANSDWLWHALHTPRIEVGGDSATAHWTIVARSKPKGGSEANLVVGRYHDSLRRTPKGWRISAIRFVREDQG